MRSAPCIYCDYNGPNFHQPDVHSCAGKTDSEIILEYQNRIAQLESLLGRYRRETPLGSQPHMIAHKVDELLGEV